MDAMIGKLGLLGLMCLAMGAVMYLLYINGWMILNSKSAVTFVGSRGAMAASFSGCSGSIKRIIRFPEDRVYHALLDCLLTKGSMSVTLLDPEKREVLCLSSDQPRAEVKLERKKRYTLILHFRRATGRYGLHLN